MFSDLPDSQFWFRRFGLDYRIFQYFWRTLNKTAVFGHRSFQTMTQKECDFLEVTRAVLNPVLDFLEARIFHTCASHIFKTPASRSIFENHRKPIFEIVIFTYCHNASHVFTLYTCSPYVHFYITPSPMYFKVFSCSQIYQTRNSGLGVLDLIIEYFNIFGVPL